MLINITACFHFFTGWLVPSKKRPYIRAAAYICHFNSEYRLNFQTKQATSSICPFETLHAVTVTFQYANYSPCHDWTILTPVRWQI